LSKVMTLVVSIGIDVATPPGQGRQGPGSAYPAIRHGDPGAGARKISPRWETVAVMAMPSHA
jgi:hypothetical protein